MKNDKCYVCGGFQHADATPRGGHKFWPEREARADLEREARRHPPTYDPAAAYPL